MLIELSIVKNKDFVDHISGTQEVNHMRINRILSGLALVIFMFMIVASGCGSATQPPQQKPMTSHMKSAVGTSDELSPMTPPEAKNVRKVGNQWQCEINGKEMKYNPATAQWENMVK
jgi:hypothetical protein